MHDDDYYTPGKDWSEVYKAVEEGKLPIWDGLTHIQIEGDPEAIYKVKHFDRPYGELDSLSISQFLQGKGGLTVSPVCTILHRETAIDILKRADTLLQKCCSRPNMMIGNDLWLFLGHFLKYAKIQYIEDGLTTFGHHAGSETVSANARLIQYYDQARDIWKTSKSITNPQILHVTHGESYPLMERAKKINSGRYVNGVVRYESFPEIKVDSKLKTPCINDLIDDAVEKAAPSDFICYSNADIILCDNFYGELVSNCQTACWSHRINIPSELNGYPRRIKYDIYPGADLFAFKVSWWLENRDKVPKLLIGYEGWDSVFMDLVKRTGGYEVAGLSYHINHKSHWEDPENRHTDLGQTYNRERCKEYLIKQGVYRGQYEEGVVEAELIVRAEPVVEPPKSVIRAVDVQKIQREGFFFKPNPRVKTLLPPLILAIQYYDGDKEQAEELISLLCDIEAGKSYKDVHLLISYRYDSQPPEAWIVEKAKKTFITTIVKKGIRNQTGHPAGCNALWMDTMVHASELGNARQIDYVFTFEADCVPIKKDWIDSLRRELVIAKEQGKKVIGHVNEQTDHCIEHINGNAVFHTQLVRNFPILTTCPPSEPWDLWIVKHTKNFWFPSSFIFNAYRKSGWGDENFIELQKKGHSMVHGIRDRAGFDFVRKIIKAP